MPTASDLGKLVFLIASSLRDARVAWCGSGGKRTEFCHWAVLICDVSVTRDAIGTFISDPTGAPSEDPPLGLLFELRQVGNGPYALATKPGLTAKGLATEFPVRSFYFVGNTAMENADIISTG